MYLGHPVFELENPASLRVRVGDSRELQNRRDMRLVLLPYGDHALRWAQVVVAVRHAKPTLQQKRTVVRRIAEVRCNPQTEEVRSVELRTVEYVNIAPQCRT